jgi:hypothetical protein
MGKCQNEEGRGGEKEGEELRREGENDE